MTTTPDSRDGAGERATVNGGEAAGARAQRRERAVADALRALLRDYYRRRFGAQAQAPQQVALDLRVVAEPAHEWEVRFEPPFDEQAAQQLADAEAMPGVYRRGYVYCFRCDSSECDHAHPPTALSVFRGYASTGVPEWCEAVQAFVEARDDRVDRLYARPPAVLARMQFGRDLRVQQLGSFGRTSRTYSILGQVVAGYFLLPRRFVRAGGDRRVAVTLQAVENRGPDGRACLRLNPVAGGMAPGAWDELVMTDWWPTVGNAFDRAERELEEVQGRVQAARHQKATSETMRRVLGRVPGILQRLVRALERGARQGARRTQHVRDRQVKRPVHKAIEDASAARDDALFFDPKKQTIVACGKQGRSHVFNPEGRHVTSFFLPPGGAAFRVRTERWRPLTPEEIASFRARIET